MRKTIIAVENSTWNNIGDAFYQESLTAALRLAHPDACVVNMDGPIRRAFRPGRLGQEPFDARHFTTADHYIFSGPIVGRNFMSVYAPRIKEILAQEKKYSLISVHADGDDLDRIKSFLQENPPQAIYTRDPLSLRRLAGIVRNEISGPCFAFFVKKLDGIPDISMPNPYLAISVYTSREPQITTGTTNASIEDVSVQWTDDPRSRKWKFLRHLEWHSALRPQQPAPFDVVRPVQSHSRLSHVTFARPNAYISYSPLCYLGVIKGSAAVVSDRVHAGVTALSFGRPIHVRRLDERYDIFTDIPLDTVGNFNTLDGGFVDEKYEESIAWLREVEL